jgi:hypothetical protein
LVTVVGITETQFAQIYPRLFHMAEDGTWESVRRNGLLSTSALLDMYEVEGTDRAAIESEHRPQSIAINHPVYGDAVVRDQKPMNEAALRGCLIDLTPNEWYQVLNSKVFFWPTYERLIRLLKGREYKNRTHCVITVDTALLLERHADNIRLSPYNSGCTLYNPPKRGRDTFLPLQDYPFDERRKKAGIKNAVAEITVEYSVPNIADLTIKVTRMKAETLIETIYER